MEIPVDREHQRGGREAKGRPGLGDDDEAWALTFPSYDLLDFFNDSHGIVITDIARDKPTIDSLPHQLNHILSFEVRQTMESSQDVQLLCDQRKGGRKAAIISSYQSPPSTSS